jgi:hypothetical protein
MKRVSAIGLLWPLTGRCQCRSLVIPRTRAVSRRGPMGYGIFSWQRLISTTRLACMPAVLWHRRTGQDIDPVLLKGLSRNSRTNGMLSHLSKQVVKLDSGLLAEAGLKTDIYGRNHHWWQVKITRR